MRFEKQLGFGAVLMSIAAASPVSAAVYDLTDLNSPIAAAPVFFRGSSYVLTNNGNIYYSVGQNTAYAIEGGVRATVAGSGYVTGGNNSGAIVRGGQIINTISSGSVITTYPGLMGNYVAIDNNNDVGSVYVPSYGQNGRTAADSFYGTRFQNIDLATDAAPGQVNAELTTMNNNATGAGVIVSNGTVVGAFTSHYATSDPSEFLPPPSNDPVATDVTNYSGDIDTVAGVSNKDEIAGSLEVTGVELPGSNMLPVDVSHAYIGQAGSLTDIGALGASSEFVNGLSYGYGINSSGVVVGSSTYGGIKSPSGYLEDLNFQHGFIYENGVMEDLNSLISATLASEYTIDSAVQINDSGEILVEYGDGAGLVDERLGLLTLANVAPAPEPATWVMMIIGLGAIGMTLRYRQKKTIVLRWMS